MPKDNVINLHQKITADDILEQAKGEFENAIVIGRNNQGRLTLMANNVTVPEILQYMRGIELSLLLTPTEQ